MVRDRGFEFLTPTVSTCPEHLLKTFPSWATPHEVMQTYKKIAKCDSKMLQQKSGQKSGNFTVIYGGVQLKLLNSIFQSARSKFVRQQPFDQKTVMRGPCR